MRSRHKSLKLRDVYACLSKIEEFYLALGGGKEVQIQREGEMLGRERKRGVKVEISMVQAARLMMCLLTTAKDEVLEAVEAEEKALAVRNK
jgi:hypothetical protein